MRVTDGMYYSNMKRSVAQRQTEYADAQERAVSQKRVSAPSDDPFAFAQARSETANLNRHEGYERTIGMAKPSLEAADNALYEIDKIMGRIRDIAVLGANDTLTPNDRQTYVQELTSLRDQLVTLGNSQAGERFIFAGYKDDLAPYDLAGLYSGDTSVQQVEVARGVTMPLGLTGERVFGSAGADVYTAITNLQTALTSNVGADVDDIIPEIDARLESVRTAHSQIGVHLNAAEVAESVSTRNQDLAKTTRSNLVDMDAAEAYTDLIRAQSALQAAIEIAAQLPPPGLVGRSR
jgi:flagellar hook-associated protein 3 FlgL